MFDRWPRIERPMMDEPAVDDASSDTVHVHRKFSPDRTKRKTKASPMRRETTSWCLLMCCHWFLQTRTGGISVTKWATERGPWACHGIVLFLGSKDHGRLLLEKILCTWYREENVRSSLDISLFVRGGGGEGETRRNFPQQRLAEVWLARSPITTKVKKKSFALRVLLSGWNSPPQKFDDRSHQTWIFALWRAPVLSKLKKTRKSEVCLAVEEWQNFLAAA